jgi:hypothetical protein
MDLRIGPGLEAGGSIAPRTHATFGVARLRPRSCCVAGTGCADTMSVPCRPASDGPGRWKDAVAVMGRTRRRPRLWRRGGASQGASMIVGQIARIIRAVFSIQRRRRGVSSRRNWGLSPDRSGIPRQSHAVSPQGGVRSSIRRCTPAGVMTSRAVRAPGPWPFARRSSVGAGKWRLSEGHPICLIGQLSGDIAGGT